MQAVPVALRQADVVRSPGAPAHCRIRRRGPRSSEATLRRSLRHYVHTHDTPELDGRLCESSLSPSRSDSSFSLIHLNIRGFLSHRHELEVYLGLLGFPSFVGLTETFLDRSVGNPTLHRYCLVLRSDRRDGRSHGGIAFFARDDVAALTVHVGDSGTDERSWHLIHCDFGPLLVGLWYRPPSHYETASIERFGEELRSWSHMSIGTVVLGDMNIHHSPWLKYSSRASPAGRALLSVSNEFGLVEPVKRPTRGAYLLDLVLSDLASGVRTEVRAGIADHSLILATIASTVPSSVAIERWCFQYKFADWAALFEDLDAIDWSHNLAPLHSDQAALYLTNAVLENAKLHIPYSRMRSQKCSHPWINGRCRELLLAKHAAAGSDLYHGAQQACSSGLVREYAAYIGRTKARLLREPNGSK